MSLVDHLIAAEALGYRRCAVTPTAGRSPVAGADGRIDAAWVRRTGVGLIGQQGAAGFGVGVYPYQLPPVWMPLPGCDDPLHENYGNYQYNDSQADFVPLFFYRVGHPASPRYAVYGQNAIDVVGIDTFSNVVAANAAGYALHRAFIDGGQIKAGFFRDKYLCSPSVNGGYARSIKNGVPISLTTTATYTRSAGMTGCTGILADAVTLCRARGAGWNASSIWIEDALRLLSVAHAQAATSVANCAWYDPAGITSYPKGCNSNTLADINDPSVTFTSAGDAGSSAKPRAGSGMPFAKTTHNGQACGISDVNGSMWRVALGITNPGVSGTDSAQLAHGNAYVLKQSVALASLTAGWNAETDAWGDAAALAVKYDLAEGLFPWGNAIDWVRFGNGANRVFSGAVDGIDWLRACAGIQQDNNGVSASGTNLFGQDGCYRYNRANLFPIVGGNWNDAGIAGPSARSWNAVRSNAYDSVGFCAAAYGQ